MMALGFRLQRSGLGRMARWHNGLLIEAHFVAGRVRLTVRDADASIVVSRTSATLDGAADKVRETIVAYIPRWSDLLFGERYEAAQN